MHVEDYTDDAPVDQQYYADYGDLSVHDAMLSDGPRMAFYRNVLADPATGLAGSIVVDVGAGTGILSAWALQLGQAAHVIAIEASGLGEALLPKTLRKAARGLAASAISGEGPRVSPTSSRFTVVHASVEDMVQCGVESFLADCPAVAALLQAGRPVAFIVSEWMGFYLVHECMLPAVLLARDFFCSVNLHVGLATAAGGGSAVPTMVPSHAALFGSAITVLPLMQDAATRFGRGGRPPVAAAAAAAARVDPSSSSASAQPDAPPVPAPTALPGLLAGMDLAHVGRALMAQKLSVANPIITVIPAACCLQPLPLEDTAGAAATTGGAAGRVFDLAVMMREDALSIQRSFAIDFASTAIDSWRRTVGEALSANAQLARDDDSSASDDGDGDGDDPVPASSSSPINVDGFAIWFAVSFGAHVLHTGPQHPPTHWKQTVVLLPAVVRASGQLRLDGLAAEQTVMRVVVGIACTDEDRRQYTIEVGLEGDD